MDTASDDVVWNYARDNGMIVVSEDSDFYHRRLPVFDLSCLKKVRNDIHQMQCLVQWRNELPAIECRKVNFVYLVKPSYVTVQQISVIGDA